MGRNKGGKGEKEEMRNKSRSVFLRGLWWKRWKWRKWRERREEKRRQRQNRLAVVIITE